MKKRMKQLLAMGMVSALSLSVLSGCGDNSSKKEESVTQEVEKESEAQESEKESETQVDEKDMPVLKVIMPFNEQNDLELVEEAANEILMAKIGAKIDLQYIPSGTYGEKMNYKYTAGEAWDVCFTSNWMNNVDKAVDNEVFMPLDDLINEYCPALWDEMADYWWDAAKYDGQVYAVPNQQLIVGYSGLCIDKKWADKYELDAKSVKTIDDIEPFLQQIADNETEVWAYQPYGNWWTQNFAEISTCVGYNYNAEDLTAMFCWEDEGWLLGIEKQYEWFENGYVRNDIASVLDDTNDYLANKYVVTGISYRPENKATLAAKLGIEPVIILFQGEGTDSVPRVSRSSAAGSMLAVNVNSEHPDKAIQYINLVNTDVELYNLLCYGIEGEHYEWVDENHIKMDETSGYYVNCNWAIGCTFNGYLLEGQDVGIHEEAEVINNSAEKSRTFAFSFDTTNIQTEITQMQTVQSEFINLWYKGCIDPEEYLPEYIDRMKEAGAEKVKEELQHQLDEYSKTTGEE